MNSYSLPDEGRRDELIRIIEHGKVKAEVFVNAIKHDYRSPNPTTRWSDIIKLK